MGELEDFINRKPLNERMRLLMRGEDEEIAQREASAQAIRGVDSGPVTDDDREFLRQLSVHPGWQVLLKLLDIELCEQEDAARRTSLQRPLTRKDEIATAWAELAADRDARRRIEARVTSEVEALQESKKRKSRVFNRGKSVG